MAYAVENLSWIREMPRLNDEQQKVLLALSHDRYIWRTKQGLMNATGLERDQLESALADVIARNLVRPSFSRNGDIIYGLVRARGGSLTAARVTFDYGEAAKARRPAR